MKISTDSKLKVCHIISGDLWAGAESMTFNLLRHLNDYRAIELVIIVLNEGTLAERLKEIGINVHVIDEKQLSFFEIVRRVRTILRTDHPDLIHSHRYKENIIALLTAAFNRSIKLIATQHGMPELTGDNVSFSSRFISRINFYLLSRCFTKTVAVSADVKKTLVTQYAFRENNIESIHNGIEVPDASLPRRKEGTFVIGSSGRLFPVKDYPLMVDVARAIACASEEEVHFELAGEGPERAVIESMVQKYELQDRFILTGHLDDMDTFYDCIDIYLNTSVHEGIPMTILEALARGIPVIAPAVGGINEIITNGVEGFLVEDRTPEAFAEKCLFLRDNRELRENMSRAARDKAGRYFSAGRMAEKYYRLYSRTGSPTGQWQESDAVSWAR